MPRTKPTSGQPVRSGGDDEAQGHLCRNPQSAQELDRSRRRRPLQGPTVGMGRKWRRLGNPMLRVMILASLATGIGAVPFTGCYAKLAVRLRGGGAGPGGGGLIGGCLPFRDLIRKMFSRDPEADDGESPLTGGGQPRRVMRVMHSQSTPAMRELLELNLPPLAGPAAPAAKAHGRRAEKPGLIIKGDNLKPEVMNSYENRHAALQWNADGTFAQGVVPLQYSSSHTSSSEDSTSSSSTSSQTEEKPPAQLRRNTRRVIRGDRRAEHVRERWEEEGFTTYVPISPVNDDEEDEELFEEVARRWRDKSMHRRRLFYPEHRGVAGICCTRGRREAMEDAVSSYPTSGSLQPSTLVGQWVLFGVYDGHGGDRASGYCRDHLLSTIASFAARPPDGDPITAANMSEALRLGFLKTDQHFVADAERNEWMDGTTVIVAAISHDSIVVANAGDSRAVMGVVRQGMVEGEEVVTAVALSKDQRPRDPEELKRIEAAGGVVVTRKGIPRVMGVLAVARAIGDAQLKPYVTADPEIRVVDRAEETWFLIIATDGLWDVISNKEAVQMVFDRLNDETSLFKGARRLCHEAYKRGSTDNISVVVIDLRSLEWARFSRRNEDDASDEGQ